MKIFVTGATGYIGGQLMRRLIEDGHNVVALCRQIPDKPAMEGLTWKTGSLEDRGSIIHAMKDCSLVYHLGAVSNPWYPDPKIYYRVNVLGTENILEAAEIHLIEKLVFTSTVGVYGKSLSVPLTEDDPRLEPFDNAYDITKAIAEQRVRSYAAKGHHAVIVNPARVYGPGKNTKANTMTRVIRDFISNSYYMVPDKGEAKHSYVFVEDIVEGHLLAMERGRSGENYILGGDNISYNEFFEALENLTGLKRKKIGVPGMMIYYLAKCNMLWTKVSNRNPFLTPSYATLISTSHTFNTNKARIELGYIPLTIKEGLLETLDVIGFKTPKSNLVTQPTTIIL